MKTKQYIEDNLDKLMDQKCTECDDINIQTFSDSAYGAPKSFPVVTCRYDQEEHKCPYIEELAIEELEGER